MSLIWEIWEPQKEKRKAKAVDRPLSKYEALSSVPWRERERESKGLIILSNINSINTSVMSLSGHIDSQEV
jgi:hypothetical protein